MTDAWRDVSAGEIERLTAAAALLAERLGITISEAVGRLERLAARPLPGSTVLDLSEVVRSALRIRARRNERLAVDLFRDPAWDMLLELLVAHHERRPVSISSLCFASGVPATTALRYVERMVEEGLILRSGDFADHRRVLVSIAPDRIGAIEAVVRELHLMTRDGAGIAPPEGAASPA